MGATHRPRRRTSEEWACKHGDLHGWLVLRPLETLSTFSKVQDRRIASSLSLFFSLRSVRAQSEEAPKKAEMDTWLGLGRGGTCDPCMDGSHDRRTTLFSVHKTEPWVTESPQRD